MQKSQLTTVQQHEEEMVNILEKKGDNITRAINFIDAGLRENPHISVHKLISDSGARFNLSPKDEEYLVRFFKQRQAESGL